MVAHLGELGLANASGPGEEHGGNGAARVLEPCACTLHGARDRAHSVRLPNHPLLRQVLEAQKSN